MLAASSLVLNQRRNFGFFATTSGPLQARPGTSGRLRRSLPKLCTNCGMDHAKIIRRRTKYVGAWSRRAGRGRRPWPLLCCRGLVLVFLLVLGPTPAKQTLREAFVV